jgi:hypothetical protein
MIAHTLLTLGFLLHAADAKPEARIVPAKNGAAFVEIIGIDKATLAAIAAANPTAAELAKACKLVVGEGKPDEIAARPGISGTWSLTDKAIRFEPQFSLVPGVRYRLTCDFAKLPRANVRLAPFERVISIPKPPPGPATAITAVFPSANRLPENTLRFYVHFSGQMTRGNIYRHFKLVRDDGVIVKNPFLELDEELWSTDGLRVTILFHPGRVKRELVPREEDGPILEEGRRYTLSISREWKDAEGRPFAAEFKKTFLAGPPDEEPIDPRRWALMAPRGGSKAPVIIRLAKPLDRALLASTLSIVDASGKKVEGETTVGGGERVVTFAPTRPWQKGEYRLVVAHYLEDVCGNRVGESFEVDVTKPRASSIPTEKPFTVR